MTPKRQSRYKRSEKPGPMRFSRGDLAIVKLYGPEHQHQYLTARTIALLLRRPLNSLQHRLKDLYDHLVLGRHHPPHAYIGGSQPCVYYLDVAGARKLTEHYKRRVKAKTLEPGYHPFLRHSVLVDYFRAIIHRAVEDSVGLSLAYEFMDREFCDHFKATYRSVKNSREVSRDGSFHISPDWTFALEGGYDAAGNPLPMRNFYMELQRSDSHAAKEPRRLRSHRKSLKHKLQSYYLYYKHKRWLQWPEGKVKKYGTIQQPGNLRVLFITEGMSQQEHDNVIALSRKVDERGGIRLFLFLRLESIAEDPVREITQPVFETPVIGDAPRSIFA